MSLADSGADISTDTMTISATVAKNVATSSVVIPENLDMGTLSKVEDTSMTYTLEVKEGYGQTVTIVADQSEVVLTSGDAELALQHEYFDDMRMGGLAVSADDVAAVASDASDLNFTGSLSFTITVS